jgi:hypothetical protein
VPLIDSDGGLIGHLCLGPDTRRYCARSEVKWCFSCRSYEVHQLVMGYDSEPSYYEPVFWWECPLCGTDATRMW